MFGWHTPDGGKHDPGFEVPCPHCGVSVGLHAERPIQTISLMRDDRRDKSYFYRVHTDCHASANETDITEIESRVIDGVN